MSEGAREGDRDTTQGAIPDDQLPEDLQPGEGNPLAEPLPAGDTADLGVPDPAAVGTEDDEAADGAS